MFENSNLTCHATATRYTNGELKYQSNIILKNKQLVNFVESISQMVIILNKYRQVVYANKNYLNFCKSIDHDPVLGKRPGEIFNCRNAFKSINGCGTSINCKSCGAVNAILESQKGKKSTKDCQILTTDNNAVDLKITATPLNLEGEKLTIFSVLDLRSEKRRISLERVFIHDILNSAGAISGLSAILKEINDPNDIAEIASTIELAASNLIEEIKAQREFSAAERGDLQANISEVESLSVLKELQKLYNNHELNLDKTIWINPNAENLSVNTDRILIKRILGNMIKNAIEANQPDDEITLNCFKKDNSVCFSIQNKSVIPDVVQRELFKRFYSTKGAGRGLGTYSMKLLGENYLGGKVWFSSNQEEGTTFYFEL
ncbi:HAMP domain-containing sensor histidine kinase [Prolixibacteraceae bacterium Z1-6]|uniref:HAMP domain-containing sensor histidine kinase n=1 Tax=Draconibacterium aestuarii TaxID=2998507 RepID=A0A9X3J916_9BACT|nr:HAMP domain-containing sensor histidine kinase [Prolixibacteraceae bacterium Z1-6]